MNKIFVLKIVIFFILFSFQKHSFSYERVYKYEVPDQIKIIFNDYKKYLIQIHRASEAKNPYGNPYIKDKFKKNSQIKGSYLSKSNKEVLFKGKARITGDWLDHISKKNLLSSLSLSLDYGNIGGITKFRLLLPETRNNENEIFWSVLMEEIGFPVPFRKFIKVDLMGIERIFIFEERAEKEFLESWGFRETPIIEFDEREIWNNAIYTYSGGSKTKENWLNNNKYKIENANFIKNKTSRAISYRSINPDFIKPVFDLNSSSLKLFHLTNDKYASHGLNAHNRKYIYDAIYNDYIPIYFDGNINIDKDVCKSNSNFKKRVNKQKLEKIKQKFSERTLELYDFSKEMECIANEIIEISDHQYNLNYKGNANLYDIKKIEKISYNYGKETEQLFSERKLKYRPPVYNYYHKTDQFEKCYYNYIKKVWELCKNLNELLFKKSFLGNDKFFQTPDIKYTVPINIDYTPTFKEKFNNIKAIDTNININVDKNEITYLKILSNNSKINIQLNDHTSYVVIYKSKIINSEIHIKTDNKSFSSSDSRYNEKLLTGCVTVIDSEIKDTSLSSKNCTNEDGLNFIRTHGKGISLDIVDALYDGFDADFSNLNFNQIKIKNSGNDCVDVSSGTYNFKNLILENCGDKGVSIGENSISSINDIYVSNSKYGIASKDLSVAYISKIISKDVNECLAMYQKKQEYGYGKIYLLKNPINICDITNTENLIIGEINICKNVDRNHFYTICWSNDYINISFNVKNFSNYDLFLKDKLGKEKKISLKNKNKKCKKINLNCEYEVVIKNLEYKLISLKKNDITINTFKF